MLIHEKEVSYCVCVCVCVCVRERERERERERDGENKNVGYTENQKRFLAQSLKFFCAVYNNTLTLYFIMLYIIYTYIYIYYIYIHLSLSLMLEFSLSRFFKRSYQTSYSCKALYLQFIVNFLFSLQICILYQLHP